MRLVVYSIIAILLFVGIVLAGDFDSDRYSAWKRGLASSQDAKVLLVHNDYIAVQLDDNLSADYGRFNIGTWPDGECLTYVYPSDPWSSWVIVRVDGESYVAPGGGPSVDELVPLSSVPFAVMTWPTDADSNYIFGGWYVPDYPCIQVYQFLQPVYLEYPTYTTGTIFIKYIVVNTCSECHDIGILLQLDTDIAGNDAAPLSTIYGYSGIEEDFWNCDTCTFPCYWYAYEDPAGPSGDPDQLIALGILCGYDAVVPDRFAVGSWPTFYDVDWNLTPSGSGYWDSAVLMWWYPEEICPGETLITATYFGLGEPLTGEITINIPIYPSVVNCEYDENPFSVLVSFTNGTGTIMSDPVATIVLPAGLSPAPGYSYTEPLTDVSLSPGEMGNADWEIQIDSAVAYGESICVYITSPSIDTFFYACRDFWLPEINPPVALIGTPFDGAVSACSGQQLTMFFDAPNGFDELLFLVDEDTIDISDARLQIVGDSIVFTPTADWANGQYHTFGIVYINDTLGCSVADIYSSFFVDTAPPVASDEYPADGDVLGTTDFGNITLTLTDAEREVNPTTIIFVVDGVEYTIADTALTYDSDVLTFAPDIAGVSFGDGDTICCSLTSAADGEVDYCEPNYMDEPYSWCFSINIVDIWLPDTTACPGDTIDIPVFIEDVTGFGIVSLDITIGYFASVLTPIDVIEAGGIASDWSDMTMSIPADGRVHIIGSGAEISGQGVLFFIRFVVGEHMGAYSLLTFDDASFNDGTLSSNTTDGFFTACWESVQWSGTIYFWAKNMPMRQISFGASESATDGYDSTIDLMWTPPPPGEIDAWFDLDDPEHPEIEKLVRDFRDYEDTLIVWQAHATYGSPTESVFVYWNPAGLPDGMLLLEYTTPLGDIAMDMHTDTSFVFFDSTDITITFLRSSLQRESLDLCPGWNLMSLPILPVGEALIREIIHGAITDGFWYNPIYHGYDILMSPAVGKAFWVFLADSATVDMAGMDVPTIAIHLWAGWNMVGVPADEDGYVLVSDIEVVPDGSILTSNIFWFDACGTESYALATDTLFVGLGYWVFALGECDLSIGSGGLLKQSITQPAKSFDIWTDDEKLTVALDDNASSGIDNFDLLIPPPPPYGEEPALAFICDGYRLSRDARQEGEFTIDAPAGTELNWRISELPGGYSFTLIDGATECDMSYTDRWLTSGSGKIKVVANKLPNRISLLPNKPNPFNSATEIRFVMPQSDEVSVELFNVRGLRVRRLFSGQANAGLNSVIWDGKNDAGEAVSSGLYFIRLKTKSTTLTEKITLIK